MCIRDRVDVAAAVETPAYITVDGQTVGKLELGDDPSKNGVYNIAFTLNNISDQQVSYDVEVVLMRPLTGTSQSLKGEECAIIEHSDKIIRSIPAGTVTAAANGRADYNTTVSLTAAEKAELDGLFENGTYVEGFVILKDNTGKGNAQLGLPMLSFYGDWTKAPIFDKALWFDEPEDGENVQNNECSWGVSLIGSALMSGSEVIGYIDLGQNMFTGEEQKSYNSKNITISPNGDGYLERIDDYILYQLRDARLIVVEVKDAETGEVYMKDGAAYAIRSIYNATYGFIFPYSLYGTIPSWNGTDMEGNVLPSGTKCIYTITAYGEGDYGQNVYDEEVGRDAVSYTHLKRK